MRVKQYAIVDLSQKKYSNLVLNGLIDRNVVKQQNTRYNVSHSLTETRTSVALRKREIRYNASKVVSKIQTY